MVILVCIQIYRESRQPVLFVWLDNNDNSASVPGDWSLIPDQVIPKAKKKELYISLVNTQHYKVRIKGKVEQSKERRSDLPNTSVL